MCESSLPEPNQPIFLTETQVQFVIDGSLTSAPARVMQHLWPSPGVTVKVSNVARNPQPIPLSSSDPAREGVSVLPTMSEGPSMVQLDNGRWIRVVPSSWLPFQQEAELRLQESPSTVLDSGKPIVRLQFDLLNVTGDIFTWPLTLQAQPCVVEISPVPDLLELEKVLRANGGYAVTHKGIVQCVEGEAFSEDEAEMFRRGLEQFLSFVCGTQCGATNVVGFDTEGKEVWKQWGSYHVSWWKRRRSWSDITVREGVAKAFERFCLEYRNAREHLDRVLGWYVYSNESSLADLSIILNQTALEVLTSLMPSGKGGKPLGERIAQMLRIQGIDPQIPINCSTLTALAERYDFEHGPHMLVAIRNSMVHPDAKVDLSSMGEYREAKQLGLWYIELLLLRMIEYEGEYASRLIDVQRPGRTEFVPWTDAVSIDDDHL